MKKEKVSIIGYHLDNKIGEIVEKTEERKLELDDEMGWNSLFLKDFPDQVAEKPSPLRWAYYYLLNLEFDGNLEKKIEKKKN